MFLMYFLPIILQALSNTSSDEQLCKDVKHKGDVYFVCKIMGEQENIRLFYKDKVTGDNYRNFTTLEKALARDELQLKFAMNGGMYHSDMSPVGLYIEDGVEVTPLNVNEGWGNFHLLPNGVFYLVGSKAYVKSAEDYKLQSIKVDYATQSGPMLVIDGTLHPRFLPDSHSLKIRNGVGVDDSGNVYFAISKGKVRFYDFATLFRDALKAPNALYLDGTISSVAVPSMKRIDWLYPMGPIIAVTEPKNKD